MDREKKGRRAYLEDFQKNVAGEYVYTGEYYVYQERGKSRRRALAELWLLCGLLAAAAVGAGCVPDLWMGRPYLILPYAAGLAAAASLCWGLGRLSAGGDPLRAYVYQQTVCKLPVRAAVTAVCAGLTLAGTLCAVIFTKTDGEKLNFLLFFGLEFVVFSAAMGTKMKLSKLVWSKR